MEETKTGQEEIKNEEIPKKKNWNFRQFIDGNIFIQDSVRKQSLYIIFLVFLSMVYIHNKYRSEGLMVDILKIQREVKELRDRSVDYAAELMSLSRESEVIKIIDSKQLGLKELKSPPEKILVKRTKDGS